MIMGQSVKTENSIYLLASALVGILLQDLLFFCLKNTMNQFWELGTKISAEAKIKPKQFHFFILYGALIKQAWAEIFKHFLHLTPQHQWREQTYHTWTHLSWPCTCVGVWMAVWTCLLRVRGWTRRRFRTRGCRERPDWVRGTGRGWSAWAAGTRGGCHAVRMQVLQRENRDILVIRKKINVLGCSIRQTF